MLNVDAWLAVCYKCLKSQEHLKQMRVRSLSTLACASEPSGNILPSLVAKDHGLKILKTFWDIGRLGAAKCNSASASK